MQLIKHIGVACLMALLPAMVSAQTPQELTVSGDPFASGSFVGYGDSGQVRDPNTSSTIYMVYSYASSKTTYRKIGPITFPISPTYALDVHLARSTNGGTSWSLLSNLWPSVLYDDPNSNDTGLLNSETPSLASYAISGTQERYFGARLVYYQKARKYYNPDYTGWFVSVHSANGSSPTVLASAPATTIGTSVTDAAWGVDHEIADFNASLADCGILNNPSIYWSSQASRLVLTLECLTFLPGGAKNHETSRVIVLSTTASGSPSNWTWEYEGVLANQDTAQALDPTALGVQQPDIAKTPSGNEVALLSVYVEDSSMASGVRSIGCYALDLDTVFSEPMLAEDPQGNLIDLAYIPDEGSCTTANSNTGIVYNTIETTGGNTTLRLWKSFIQLP